MGISILKVQMLTGGDEPLLEQRARQIAGLLGFSPDEQSGLATAISGSARAAIASGGGAEVEFSVDNASSAPVFVARITAGGRDWAEQALEAARAGDAGGVAAIEHLEVDTGPAGTTVVLGRDFPPGAPPVAGEALGRMAGELARRSRPGSVFFEIEKQNQELFRAMDDLARVNRELSSYAHTVSHDLKSPLSTVIFANEVLREKLKSPPGEGVAITVDRLIDMMNETLKQTSRMIDDLLALAEAGQEPGDISDVDVSAVVANVLEQKAPDIAARGVRVFVDEELGFLKANPTQVYQVFSNLIGNAIKHNDSRSPEISVSRFKEGEGGEKTFLVRDNGSGIPASDLEFVFMPFFKGRISGDTGIGLATVQKIVCMYGGRIRAYNDNGACFEFSLPDYAKRV